MNKYWKQLFLAALLSGFSLSAAVGLLGTSAWLISMASTRPPILVLEVAIVGVRFFGLSRGVLKYGSRLLEHDAALKAQTYLRVKVYQNLSILNPISFTKLKRGNLLSQIVNDIEIAQDLWLRILSPWISAIIAGISGLGIMFWLSPNAGKITALIFLISLVLIPLLAAFSKSEKNTRENEAELFSQIMQIAESSNEALIFNYQESLLENMALAEDSLTYLESKAATRSGFANSLYFILVGTSSIFSLYWAVKDSVNGSLATVNIAVIALLPLAIFEGLSSLPSAFSNLFKSTSALNSLKKYSEAIPGNPSANEFPLVKSVEIEFINVVPIIEGAHLPRFSAKISSGESLLISGRSGIGKSSIISSLLGLNSYAGEIKINGEHLKPKHLPLFSTLLQDDYLFASSIRENLRIGNPKASDRDLNQILEVVELADLIHKLPQGLDTHIGPLGYNFSGGEKQRIKLARVLLRNTPVFILDEPYEYLDAHQVDRIAKKVSRVLSGKTVLIVSHLPLAIDANEISLEA